MFETVRLRAPALRMPTLAATEARADRKIENLVLVVFWLLILEGALRKWVAPEFSKLLFFIRDPFVLLIYWRAWRLNAFRDAGPLLYVGLGFAVIALLLSFLQSVTFESSRILAVVVYGWRQYFLYLPLPFVIAAILNQDSLQRFARHVFIAVVLMAPLVFLQFSSPPSSVINRGISEDESLQFQSFAFTNGGIRPSGPFTTTTGVTQMIPSAFALLLGVWLTAPKQRKIGIVMLGVAAAGTATCLAMSGSRAAFVHFSIVGLSSMVLGILTRDSAVRTRALLLPLALVACGAVLYPIVFPDAFEAMLTRTMQAHTFESRFTSLGIVGRALYETVDFVRYLTDAPLMGYGFGLGGNGRIYLADSNPELVALVGGVESDWSRHIVDFGPIFGLLFILYRIVFTATVGLRALRASSISQSPFPLLLFGYAGINLFYGQLTGHGTVGGFTWLYLGLCMAACKVAETAGTRTRTQR
jgi:hypothetical protein